MIERNPTDAHDLVILGGGPAGMAAALVAGRARLDTVVVNAESPRNAITKASHGFVTRDGIHPTEFLAFAKDQLRKYPAVRYVKGVAADVQRRMGSFEVTLGESTRIESRRIVIATGYRDELDRLGIPGMVEVYGKSVFPCPFCDGFEHADERLAVFGSEGIEHFGPIVRVWSRDIVVFTHGATLPDEIRTAFAARGVPVFEQRIARLVSKRGRLKQIELEDGTSVERDAGFIATDFSVPATSFAEALGVGTKQNDWGMRVADASDSGETQVPGVYVVGDARAGFNGLLASAHEGAACITKIVHEIAGERWARPTA